MIVQPPHYWLLFAVFWYFPRWISVGWRHWNHCCRLCSLMLSIVLYSDRAYSYYNRIYFGMRQMIQKNGADIAIWSATLIADHSWVSTPPFYALKLADSGSQVLYRYFPRSSNTCIARWSCIPHAHDQIRLEVSRIRNPPFMKSWLKPI